MTVGELMKLLADYPPDIKVVYISAEHGKLDVVGTDYKVEWREKEKVVDEIRLETGFDEEE